MATATTTKAEKSRLHRKARNLEARAKELLAEAEALMWAVRELGLADEDEDLRVCEAADDAHARMSEASDAIAYLAAELR